MSADRAGEGSGLGEGADIAPVASTVDAYEHVTRVVGGCDLSGDVGVHR